MTVIARFEVIPVQGGRMSTAIAQALRALDQFDVTYETTATDTIIEADSVEEVFAAVQAAHRAIPDDRVITSLEIDEDRSRRQDLHERVASVERELGHPPRRQRPQQPPQGAPPAEGQPQMQTQAQTQPRSGGRRYSG